MVTTPKISWNYPWFQFPAVTYNYIWYWLQFGVLRVFTSQWQGPLSIYFSYSEGYCSTYHIPAVALSPWEKKSWALIIFYHVFIFSHCKSFYLLDQIKSNCMYWLYWKSEKNRTEPNELDELKCSKSLNQTTSYAH